MFDHLTRRNVFPHLMKCDDTNCFRRFENYEDMITHQLRTHRKPGVRVFLCSDCNGGFKNYSSLFSHKVAKHQELLKIHADSMPEFSRTERSKNEKQRTIFYI